MVYEYTTSIQTVLNSFFERRFQERNIISKAVLMENAFLSFERLVKASSILKSIDPWTVQRCRRLQRMIECWHLYRFLYSNKLHYRYYLAIIVALIIPWIK